MQCFDRHAVSTPFSLSCASKYRRLVHLTGSASPNSPEVHHWHLTQVRAEAALGFRRRCRPLGRDNNEDASYFVAVWKPGGVYHLVDLVVKVTIKVGKANKVPNARIKCKC